MIPVLAVVIMLALLDVVLSCWIMGISSRVSAQSTLLRMLDDHYNELETLKESHNEQKKQLDAIGSLSHASATVVLALLCHGIWTDTASSYSNGNHECDGCIYDNEGNVVAKPITDSQFNALLSDTDERPNNVGGCVQ